jgi:hypothetical protein
MHLCDMKNRACVPGRWSAAWCVEEMTMAVGWGKPQTNKRGEVALRVGESLFPVSHAARHSLPFTRAVAPDRRGTGPPLSCLGALGLAPSICWPPRGAPPQAGKPCRATHCDDPAGGTIVLECSRRLLQRWRRQFSRAVVQRRRKRR